MSFIEISQLQATANLDSDSVFVVVYQGETKKVDFSALKQLMKYYQSASYNKTTGVFTFGLSDNSSVELDTDLNESIKDISIVDGVVTITKQDGTTDTLNISVADGSITSEKLSSALNDEIDSKQDEITSSNKLESDLVDDTNQTNKFTNATEKASWNAKYNKPGTGIPKTDLASDVQTSLGKADTAIQDISSKQDITDNSLETTNKTVPGAINEVNSIAKGANQAVGYSNYSTMITALNALDDDVYNVGQNIYIVTLEVPDLWVSSVESTSSTYTYTTDAAFISALETNGYVQVGYYRLSMLETQKVDLTNYVKNIDYASSSTGGVIKISNDLGSDISSAGVIRGYTRTYLGYTSMDNAGIISKGTLENVLTARIGDISTILQELDTGSGV